MTVLKNIFFAILVISVISTLAFFSSPRGEQEDQYVQDLFGYEDGTYTGQSQDKYTAEPYWGKVKIKIEKGSIKEVNFSIRDSSLHEDFDKNYEKHFEKIPEYIEQCRNDLKGVETYPGNLVKNQSLRKVDAMSGATWSYNIFRAAADSALRKAEIK
ncbi:MAG: FMN-binding protein [Bacteroidales bacterium]